MLGVSRRTGYHKVFSVTPYLVTRGGGVPRNVGCHVVLGVMRCWVSRGVGCHTVC